jgi:hypothetical protein
MLVKTVLVFLLAMALLALIGRALFPGLLRVRRDHPARPRRCPDCGRFLIGGGAACDCGRNG